MNVFKRSQLLFLGSVAFFWVSYTPAQAQVLTCTLNLLLSGTNSQACGNQSSVDGNNSASWGAYSSVNGDNGSASGSYATVNGDNGVAEGAHSSATNGPSFSGAANATAVGAYSTAVQNSTAVGEGASAIAVNSIAYGHLAVANQSLAMALGVAASASAANSIALGSNSSAIASNSVAIGTGSLADTANTVSVGALGSERRIVNVAPGTLSVTSTDAVNGSQLNATNLALTTLQTEFVTSSVGLVVQNPLTRALTVGAGIDGTSMNLAGTAGNRTVTGLLAGSLSGTSADAVNGTQLYTANQRLASTLSGGAALDNTGQLTAPNYGILGGSYNTIGGALGALNTQVTTNTSNISSLATQVTNNTGGITTNTANITNIQNQLASGTIGLVQQDPMTQNLNVGSSAAGTVVNFAGIAGNRVLTGITDASLNSMSSDAVTGSQLYTANSRIASMLGGGAGLDANGQLTMPAYNILGNTYNTVGGALGGLNTQVTTNTSNISTLQTQTSTLQNEVASGGIGLVQQNQGTQALTVASATGGTLVNFAGTAGNRVLTGVGAGAISSTSSDVINGSQVYSANQRVAALFGGGSIVDGTGQVTAPSYSILGSTYSSVGGALGALNTQVASNTSSISSLTTQTTTNTANISSLQSQVTSGEIGVVQQNTTTRNLNVGSATDGTLVNFAGTAGNRTLTGVATGTLSAVSTDAVNGSQLFATNQALANLSSEVSGLQTGTSTPASPYMKVNSVGAGAVSTGTNAIANGAGATGSGDNAVAVGTNSLASKTGSIAVGMSSSSTGTNAIAIGTGASATGSVAVGANASAGNGGAAFGDNSTATAPLSTALGPGSSATAANAVAIGSGSSNTVENTVSFGSAGNERRLTNVAAGINSTDAVNVSQLTSVASSFQSQVSSLQSEISSNQQEARGGVALALAASGLRYDDRPGKWSIASAYGNFRGASGIAVGLGYSATDKLRFNAAVSGIPSQSIGAVVSGSLSLN